MREHILKTWPEYFGAVQCGDKPFEIRKNDRDFKVGESLRLIEYDPVALKPTGQFVKAWISYITDFEQKPGFVVLGLCWGPRIIHK